MNSHTNLIYEMIINNNPEEKVLNKIDFKKLEINKTDMLGNSILLVSCNRNGYSKLIEILLKNGANVNEENVYGITPFTYVLEDGRVEDLKTLINYGGDFSKRFLRIKEESDIDVKLGVGNKNYARIFLKSQNFELFITIYKHLNNKIENLSNVFFDLIQNEKSKNIKTNQEVVFFNKVESYLKAEKTKDLIEDNLINKENIKKRKV